MKTKKNKGKVVGIGAAIGIAVTYAAFRFVTSDAKAGIVNRFYHSKLGHKLGLRTALDGHTVKEEPTQSKESAKKA